MYAKYNLLLSQSMLKRPLQLRFEWSETCAETDLGQHGNLEKKSSWQSSCYFGTYKHINITTNTTYMALPMLGAKQVQPL